MPFANLKTKNIEGIVKKQYQIVMNYIYKLLNRKTHRMEHKKRHLTAPREQIEWYPTIDNIKCKSCHICFEYCPKQVFSIGGDGINVFVSQPYSCVVLCSGCEPRCPWGAISFPSKDEFRHYVYYI